MTNANYTDYPFTANGINFISRIMEGSPNNRIIARLPEGAFAQMNAETILELIGDVSLLTIEELEDELEKINQGGTHSFVLLGENN